MSENNPPRDRKETPEKKAVEDFVNSTGFIIFGVVAVAVIVIGIVWSSIA